LKISTHLFIEMKVKEFIDQNYSYNLGINVLCFGNVLADISHLTAMHPHYHTKSINYIKNKIKSLCEYIPGLSDEFGIGYMLNLGVVTHYICDFFCKAHASNNIGSPKEHLKYEYTLRDYIEDNFEKFDDFDFMHGLKPARSCDEIASQLDKWIKEYHLTEHNCEKDIIAALRASCYITASVMEICCERKRRILEMFLTAFAHPNPLTYQGH
jgi:hypothetical protein